MKTPTQWMEETFSRWDGAHPQISEQLIAAIQMDAIANKYASFTEATLSDQEYYYWYPTPDSSAKTYPLQFIPVKTGGCQMNLTYHIFCAWRYIRNRLPLYSWNRVCSEWELGRIDGQRQVGIARGPNGRFKRYE